MLRNRIACNSTNRLTARTRSSPGVETSASPRRHPARTARHNSHSWNLDPPPHPQREFLAATAPGENPEPTAHADRRTFHPIRPVDSRLVGCWRKRPQRTLRSKLAVAVGTLTAHAGSSARAHYLAARENRH